MSISKGTRPKVAKPKRREASKSTKTAVKKAKPKKVGSKAVKPVRKRKGESAPKAKPSQGAKSKYPDESSFLTSVFLEKQERGTVEHAWIVAALSTWPSSQKLRKQLASYAVVDNPLNVLGPLGSILPEVVLLATHTLRNLFGKSDESDVEEISASLENALRVFRDLQSIRKSDPETYREEMEHLFDDLVEDRRISG